MHSRAIACTYAKQSIWRWSLHIYQLQRLAWCPRQISTTIGTVLPPHTGASSKFIWRIFPANRTSVRIMRIYEKEQAIVGATEQDRDKNKESERMIKEVRARKGRDSSSFRGGVLPVTAGRTAYFLESRGCSADETGCLYFISDRTLTKIPATFANRGWIRSSVNLGRLPCCVLNFRLIISGTKIIFFAQPLARTTRRVFLRVRICLRLCLGAERKGERTGKC